MLTLKIVLRLVLFFILIFCVCCAGSVSPPTESSARIYTEVKTTSDELQIFIVDVGQGDATLVVGPKQGGSSVALLIDSGGLDPDGGMIVFDLLQSIGLAKIDYIVLSHYDADHMGGFVTAYHSTSLLWDQFCEPGVYFPTRAMIDLGDSDKDTDSVLEYLTCRDVNVGLLQEGHVVVGSTPHQNIGAEFDLQGGYTATLVAGNGYVIDQEEAVSNVDTDNEKSVAVLISGPENFHFLVTGDLTGRAYGAEDAAVESSLGMALQARGVDVAILRVGHHGSRTSSAPDFLQSLQPEVAIISVGSNSYGHPHCDTLVDLTQSSELVLQTETGNTEYCEPHDNVVVANDTILITVNGADYAITSQNLDYGCTVTRGCE